MNLLVLRKLPPSDYRNHRTVWSPGGKNRRIFVVCGIQRFDDNSDLILRPQSRISWIISPQCIIIIGVVVFVTVESVSSLEDLGIIAARTRDPVIQLGPFDMVTLNFPAGLDSNSKSSNVCPIVLTPLNKFSRFLNSALGHAIDREVRGS